MQSTNPSAVASLHAANPSLKILMYMDPLDSSTTDPNAGIECTSYTSDLANHPGWFVRDSSGNKINGYYSSSEYVMNVGDPTYQQACVAHATALAKQNGFDGVFWDNVMSSYVFAFPKGVTSPTFPTVASWQAAYTSFLNYSGSIAHSDALLLAANIGAASTSLWQQWNAPLDGAAEESFTDGGSGLAQQLPFLATKLANVSWSEANGKFALLHSYNGTEAGNTYGLSAMLLVAGGRSQYATSNTCYTNCEVWYPEYSTAQQLGQPVGTYITLPNGVYIKWYSNGLVLLNPTSSSIPAFSLGGGTYTGSGLTRVSSVSMAPTTAYVLEDDPGNAASAPTNTASPGITGSVWQYQTLSAATGTWAGSPAPTYQYQWNRCSTTSPSSCAPIPGATAKTYEVLPADVGKYLEVGVTGTNSSGIASATSAETIQVPTPTFSLTASPTSQSRPLGYGMRFSITVNPTAGWTGPVNFTAAGAPPGGSLSLSATSSATSTSVLVTSSSASKGTWPITVTGTAGGQSHSVTVTATFS